MEAGSLVHALLNIPVFDNANSKTDNCLNCHFMLALFHCSDSDSLIALGRASIKKEMYAYETNTIKPMY